MDRFDDDDDFESQSDQTEGGVAVGSTNDMLKSYGRYAHDIGGSKNTSMNTSKLKEDADSHWGPGDTPSKRPPRKGSNHSQQTGSKRSRLYITSSSPA